MATTPDQHMVSLIVRIESQDSASLEAYDRGQKYKLLKENHQQIVDGIITWLEAQNLGDQVESIEPPTVFDTLFMRTSEVVAARLENAPGVVKVAVVEQA